MGVRPARNSATSPAASATTTFCAGLLMRATASPASSSVPARFSACSPEAAVSPGARLAICTASTVPGGVSGESPPGASRSDTTGPWRVSRTRSTVSGWPRTAIRSSRSAKGRGPSGVS